MIKVHGARVSPFVRKVLTVLELKGLPYEWIHAAPFNQKPEFFAISPLGKIPAFEDGALRISDSTVICEYLEEQYPQVPTLPQTPIERARARWLEEYADTRMMELCGPALFFERVIKPKVLKQETDTAKVDATITLHLPPVLDYLESQMPASGFLFGEFGRADISVAGPLIIAEYAHYTIDTDRWPKLAAFLTRVKAISTVAKLLEVEASLFSR